MQTKVIFAPSTKQREALEHERLCLMEEQTRVVKERDEIVRNIGAHLDDLDAEISKLGGLPRTLLPPKETARAIEVEKAIRVGGYATIRKKRGRPPARAPSDITAEPSKKKKRGRPRKINIGPQHAAELPSPRAEVSKTLSSIISSIVDFQETCSVQLQPNFSPGPTGKNGLLHAIYNSKLPTKRKKSSLVQGLAKADPKPSPRAETAIILSNIISKITGTAHDTLVDDESVLPPSRKRGRGRPKKCLVEELSVPKNPGGDAWSPISNPIVQKRGPGRPRKSLVEKVLPLGHHPPTYFHTGCNVSNASANKPLHSTMPPQKRGRPRKNPIFEPSDVPKKTGANAEEALMPVRKKPRGRPRKHTSPSSDCHIAEDSHGYGMANIRENEAQAPTVLKKKRGRPRKNLAVKTVAVSRTMAAVPEQDVSAKPKHARGRPRKRTQPAADCNNLVGRDNKIYAADNFMDGGLVSAGPKKKKRGRPRKNPSVESDAVTQKVAAELEQAEMTDAKQL